MRRPPCRVDHRVRDEPAAWKRIGIEPIEVARKLWEGTRLRSGGPKPEP